MGRPRKHPLPTDGAAAVALAPPPEPEAEAEEEGEEAIDPDTLEPEQLVALALDNPRMRLTPAMVAALNQMWRENVRADDDEGKAHARRIAGRLRRASHGELHPGCQRITITVPALRRRNGGVWYVTINERKYVGKVDVWECEARTIFELAYRFDVVENERMDETRAIHTTFDLDTGALVAERARLIREA